MDILRGVACREELLGVGSDATWPAHFLGSFQVEVDDAVGRSNVTIASTMGGRHRRVESPLSTSLGAVPIAGKAHELTNVAALEAGCPMEGACGGLEARGPVLRRRVVRDPDRVAGLRGNLFAVHEERCHRQAHLL